MKPKKSIGVLTVALMLLVLFCDLREAQAFVFQDRITTSKSLAHYAMGQIFDLLGYTNRAVFEYEKAAQFDEGSYLIHLRLGANYARLNMLRKSEEHLKKVNSYNPEELQSHYLLALIYSTEKKYGEAAEEYEYILKTFSESEPQNVEIYGYLGQLYYSQRKYAQAVSQFEKILEFDPENADVRYLLGSLYIEMDEDDKAIDHLKTSISINPEHDGSLNTLGYLYAESGKRLSEAQELIERALAISPDNGAYLDSLGWLYYQKKEYDKALEYLVKADSLLKDPVIYEHLGDVYLKLNKREEALKNWKMSLEMNPGQEEIKEKINSLENNQASR